MNHPSLIMTSHFGILKYSIIPAILLVFIVASTFIPPFITPRTYFRDQNEKALRVLTNSLLSEGRGISVIINNSVTIEQFFKCFKDVQLVD